MLCDRQTTNVAKSQPGFIGFVPMPLAISLCQILPEFQECVDTIKTNMKAWKEYEEDEEDKKVYERKF